MFSITPNDIQALSADAFVELLLQLPSAECYENKWQHHTRHVPLNINIPDGDEDGRIQASSISHWYFV